MFGGANDLSLTFDDHMTLGEVLTADFGQAFDGELTYNFPTAGASGSYVQSGGLPPFPTLGRVPLPGIGPGLFVSLTAMSASGVMCPGDNTPGSTISADPTNPVAVYETILGCESLHVVSLGTPTQTTTTVTEGLGSITADGVTTFYTGEFMTTVWQDSGVVGQGPPAVPEPGSASLIIAGASFAIVCRRRLRS